MTGGGRQEWQISGLLVMLFLKSGVSFTQMCSRGAKSSGAVLWSPVLDDMYVNSSSTH